MVIKFLTSQTSKQIAEDLIYIGMALNIGLIIKNVKVCVQPECGSRKKEQKKEGSEGGRRQ